MRKTFTTFLLVCIVLNTYSQIKFTINGEIPVSHSTQQVLITILNPDVQHIVAVTNGKFYFQHEIPTNAHISVFIKLNEKESVGVAVYITGGAINLKVNSDKSISITGNRNAIDDYHKLQIPVGELSENVYKSGEIYENARKNNSADSISLKMKYFKAIDMCFQVPQDYIKANPNSIVCLEALRYLGKGKKRGIPITVSDLERMFLSLNKCIRESVLGRSYAAKLVTWKDEEKKI